MGTAVKAIQYRLNEDMLSPLKNFRNMVCKASTDSVLLKKMLLTLEGIKDV